MNYGYEITEYGKECLKVNSTSEYLKSIRDDRSNLDVSDRAEAIKYLLDGDFLEEEDAVSYIDDIEDFIQGMLSTLSSLDFFQDRQIDDTHR